MTEELVESFLGKYRLSLNRDFAIEKHLLEKGSWEPHVLMFLDLLIRDGDVVVDVGANSGLHTIALADAVGETGKVYAFEPASVVHRRLMTNLNMNQSLAPRVTVEKKGVSNEPGQLKIFESGELLGNAYLGAELNPKMWNKNAPAGHELCEVITLDSYFAGKRINFLKIDVEGMEIEVLEGAARILRESRPSIIFETLVKDFDHEKIKRCEAFLRTHGYQLFYFDFTLRKIAPATFPNFQEDTVAIHESILPQIADVTANALRYESLIASKPGGPRLQLTVVGLWPKGFSAALHVKDGPITEACRASIQGNILRLDGENFSAEFDGLSIPAADQLALDASDKANCTIRYGNGQIDRIEMKWVGGTLARYAN